MLVPLHTSLRRTKTLFLYGLCVGRMLFIPLVLMAFLVFPYSVMVEAWLPAAWLFFAATDFADGALARRWQVTTPLGATLDHLADKVFSGFTFVFLAVYYWPAFGHSFSLLLLVFAFVNAARDFCVVSWRTRLAQQGQAHVLAVRQSGKIKTAFLFAGLFLAVLAMAVPYGGDVLLLVFSAVLLAVATGLSVVSGFIYRRLYLNFGKQ